jgi:hypothetical protein
MAEALTALTEQLLSTLQKETLIILNTIDAETGSPNVNAISWVYAVNPTTIRFAVDARSRIVSNLSIEPKATLSIFGGGSVHAVYGKAVLKSEALEGVPFKLACFDVEIDVIRDAMFYGARISVEPEYEKTYDKRAADKLDGQVFEAMKKA